MGPIVFPHNTTVMYKGSVYWSCYLPINCRIPANFIFSSSHLFFCMTGDVTVQVRFLKYCVFIRMSRAHLIIL